MKKSEYENQRREARLNNFNQYNQIQVNEISSYEEIIKQLNSSPIEILNALEALHNIVFDSNIMDDQLFLHINEIINILYNLTEIKNDDGIFRQIGELSISVLVQIFSMQHMGSTPKDFFSYYFISISDSRQLGISLSILKKLISRKILLKEALYRSGYLLFFISTPINKIPLEFIDSFTTIISLCIEQDMTIKSPLETPCKLLNQLIFLLTNFQDYSQNVIDQCAIGCSYFVTINNDAKIYFILQHYHLLLIHAFQQMSEKGICFSISTLGFCYCCENDEVDQILVQEIPLDLFKQGLELDETKHRIDVSIAIGNVMTKSEILLDKILDSGIYDAIINHFENDNFNIRRHLLIAILNIMKYSPSSCIHLFVNERFIHALINLMDSEDSTIEEIAQEIYVCLQKDENHPNLLSEFNEFYLNHYSD